MKPIFKSLINLTMNPKKIALAAPRFSYIDSVLDEEYSDHRPHIDPALKPAWRLKALHSAKLYFSRMTFRFLTLAVFVLYYAIHASLKAVRFIR